MCKNRRDYKVRIELKPLLNYGDIYNKGGTVWILLVIIEIL
jgi:hypothetical protein